MIKRYAALAAGVLLLIGAGTARADTISVTADVPLLLSLKLDGSNVDNSVGGYAVGVTLPFLVGFGYESYKATLDKKDFGSKGDLNFALFDVFFNLPVPVVNIAIGAGLGTATFDPSKFTIADPVLGNGSFEFGSAAVTQYFASIGIPFAAVFDVHLGYHVVSGSYDFKSKFAGSSSKKSLNLNANMTSLGVKVGF